MIRKLAFAALLVSAAAAVPALGQSVTLQNPGFELPGTSKIATGFDTTGANDVPGWSNAGTIYSDSGVEMGGRDGGWRGFLRSSDHGIFQTTSHTISANERLTLSWWGSSTWQSTELTGGLFYLDTGGQRQNLSTLGAVVGTGSGSGPFAQYTLNFDVAEGSPAIGRPVGVFFDNTSTNTGDAWAGLDDVALTVTLVPEPGALALLGLLSLPLLRRRRN